MSICFCFPFLLAFAVRNDGGTVSIKIEPISFSEKVNENILATASSTETTLALNLSLSSIFFHQLSYLAQV